jgi:predicted RNase H-like HicB family nuclease
MTFPVRIEPSNGQFTAEVVGAPDVHATAASRELAMAALHAEIAQRIQAGELDSLDVEPPGLAALFGKYADDATLTEICNEAYRQRDAELD